MGRSWIGILGAVVCALLALASAPARAAPVPAAACFALPSASPEWRCGARTWGAVPQRASLRLTPAAGAPAPRFFATRLARFHAMTLTVRGADGRSVTRRLGEADFTGAPGGWTMRTALPGLAVRIASVEAEVEGARHVGLFAEANLDDGAPPGGNAPALELTVAAICGLLCAPLLFNFAFWRVLRQRFIVWHTLTVVFMLAQTVVTSGLVNRFAALSIPLLFDLAMTTLAAAVACGALFAADVIEPDKLDPHHRRLMRATVPWIAITAALYLVADGPVAAYAPRLYYAGYLPVIAIICWTMAVAWRRGSRAVRFQFAAWLPMILVGTYRIASILGATAAPVDHYFEQHLAIIAEILITGLAVVDRFMVLRRQRDHALFETRLLEEAVERDPLTGLLNRHALEARFTAFYREGFRTIAVIDLDHFKLVNDRFGHAAGDKVLRAVAAALAPDEDTRAIRIGGEEFLLLLRGRDSAARAEQRRNAIPLRVAADVTGLDRVVTASMRLVEQADSAVNADFATLYAHCDRLLYEAKRSGRNRTMSERLENFSDRRANDRRVAA